MMTSQENLVLEFLKIATPLTSVLVTGAVAYLSLKNSLQSKQIDIVRERHDKLVDKMSQLLGLCSEFHHAHIQSTKINSSSLNSKKILDKKNTIYKDLLPLSHEVRMRISTSTYFDEFQRQMVNILECDFDKIRDGSSFTDLCRAIIKNEWSTAEALIDKKSGSLFGRKKR